MAANGYERLAALKAQIDPDNLLRYSFNISLAN
ncbi:MAG: BBE domain-containing protein [Ardenticatenaceae bacterium]|nr:BBE domain-containing protein [Ardenticatenaceae bacterium]